MPTSTIALILYLYLLPGVVGYFVLSALSHLRGSDGFEKVSTSICLAVASTILTVVFVGPMQLPDTTQGASQVALQLQKTLPRHLAAVSGFSILLAVVSSLLWNSGWIHVALRCLRLSNRTGRVDPWHQAFSQGSKQWVRLIYSDDRQLTGWVEFYSETLSNKGLVLREAKWIYPSEEDWIEETAEHTVLVTNFSDVRAIQFEPGRKEEADERQEKPRSAEGSAEASG